MHPILGDRGAALLYFAVWAVIGVMIAALLALPGAFPWSAAFLLSFPPVVAYSFICLSTYYFCRTFPVESTPMLRLFTAVLASSLVTSALWTVGVDAWAYVADTILPGAQLAERFRPQVPLFFGVGVLLFLLTVAVHFILIGGRKARETERRNFELRLLAQDAELKLLRAQIDPHFLFNSLNSVYALIPTDPEGARTMSLGLAEFLRDSLRLGAKEKILLREEISLARRFLQIEKIRFGARLKMEEAIAMDAEEALVPSLLLQPLVENAVKHGIAHLLEGGTVRIEAKRTPSRVVVRVTNPVDPARARKKGAGVGLANVRSRLATIYGNDGRLEVEESNRYFAATVTIPSTTER